MNFQQRAALCDNPAAKQLFTLMHKKKTNLALSADLKTSAQLLTCIEQCAEHICLLKTHIDILDDFEPLLIQKLQALAQRYEFMIFEDRKFADIGATVSAQYRDGIYRIADWAHITNAHVLPGPGIIEGLRDIGLAKGRGLLLLAQMSSQENLFSPEYTAKTLAFAKTYADFVIGFICQERITEDKTFIHLTPGVSLSHQEDAYKQAYRTPEQAILQQGNDVIIVGRGITHSKDPRATAKCYRDAAWQAYAATI